MRLSLSLCESLRSAMASATRVARRSVIGLARRFLLQTFSLAASCFVQACLCSSKSLAEFGSTTILFCLPKTIHLCCYHICMVCCASWHCNIQPSLNGLTPCNLILDQPSLIVHLSSGASHLKEGRRLDCPSQRTVPWLPSSTQRRSQDP